MLVEDPAASTDAPAETDSSEDAPTLRETLGRRLAPLAGSLGMSAMMAAMTGRWWILLVGLAYPAFVIVPALASTRTSAGRGPDLDALPTPLAPSRAFWSATTGTIAVVGDAGAARGFARAIVLARGRAPADDDWRETWMALLPPAEPGDAAIVFAGDAPPSWAQTTVRVGARGTTIETGGRVIASREVRVSEEAAEAWARALAGEDETTTLPTSTRVADLADAPSAPAAAGGRRTLAAPVGVESSGTLVLDLDAHGPHVVVAGTTGSGKSALLETLVLTLASRYGPDDLAIALIDFKGGAGLRTCATLPHVTGVLTDLDPHLARRAFAALAEEIADRKRRLSEVGHASFHEWESSAAAPPRLLVVIDEYQELIALYRDFLPDLTRLAAQGRSLGLHLVLATQRPAGAVTPEIRANIGSTIALRVESEAESRDLVGSRDAADLPRTTPGRAILASGGSRTVFQAALPSSTPSPRVARVGAPAPEPDAAGLAERVRETWPERRAAPLWLPPLPPRLGGRDRPTGSARRIWLGRGDEPGERAQPEVAWDPSTGPIVVTGPAGSGRTTTLETVALQAPDQGLRAVWLPADPREAARTLALTRGADDVMLVVDDGVRALAALAEVDRGRAHEEFLALLACGRPVALALPLSASTRLAAAAATRVVLAGGDPTDAALWSVPRALHGLPRLPGRAAVGEGARWIETQIASLGSAPRDGVVASLPRSLAAADLPKDLLDGRVAVGIGGDEGSVVGVDPGRPALVVGGTARERAGLVATLGSLAARCGARLDARPVENPLALPRREIEAATVIVASPTPRLVGDVFTGDASGLVDPRPGPRRVVVVADDGALAVEIAGD